MKKPHRLFVGHGDHTARLYKLEDSRNSLIKSCAKELAQLLADAGVHRPELRDMLPQALFDTLTSFDRETAYTAARAFVEFCEADDVSATSGAKLKSDYENDNPTEKS